MYGAIVDLYIYERKSGNLMYATIIIEAFLTDKFFALRQETPPFFLKHEKEKKKSAFMVLI